MDKFTIETNVNDNILKEMIELDKLVFNGEDIGDENKCREWLKRNKDIYTVLLLDGHVIAYINFMPITDTAYETIKQGKLKDYELDKNDIIEFSSNKSLKCLFTSIVAHPDYQTEAPLVLLWRGFLNKLKNLNVTISSVIADCVSEKGEKLAIHGLNAKFITNSHNGKIYEGNISEI